MVSLWFATSSLKAQADKQTGNEYVMEGLKALEKLLSEQEEG
jgi:hypothetical protein